MVVALRNICICKAKECSGLALLWVEIFEVYFGGESGSKSAVEVGDGARYWRLIEARWGWLKK